MVLNSPSNRKIGSEAGSSGEGGISVWICNLQWPQGIQGQVSTGWAVGCWRSLPLIGTCQWEQWLACAVWRVGAGSLWKCFLTVLLTSLKSGYGVATDSWRRCWINSESVLSAMVMILSHITAGTVPGALFPLIFQELIFPLDSLWHKHYRSFYRWRNGGTERLSNFQRSQGA